MGENDRSKKHDPESKHLVKGVIHSPWRGICLEGIGGGCFVTNSLAMTQKYR